MLAVAMGSDLGKCPARMRKIAETRLRDLLSTRFRTDRPVDSAPTGPSTGTLRARRARPLLVALAAVAFGALPTAPVRAQGTPEPAYDRYSLSAEASGEVANDLLVARLAVQEEDADPAALAERVNGAMSAALATLEGRDTISVRTLDYRTDPVYGKDSREVSRWRAVQQLELRTADIASGSAAIGELQATLVVQGVRLEPAPATRLAAEDALVVEALEAFAARAALVAETVGASGHRVVQADVQTEGARPPVYARAAAESRDVSVAPALAAGTSELTVRVFGTVELER